MLVEKYFLNFKTVPAAIKPFKGNKEAKNNVKTAPILLPITNIFSDSLDSFATSFLTKSNQWLNFILLHSSRVVPCPGKLFATV